MRCKTPKYVHGTNAAKQENMPVQQNLLSRQDEEVCNDTYTNTTSYLRS
jgi:hypothetical protein